MNLRYTKYVLVCVFRQNSAMSIKYETKIKFSWTLLSLATLLFTTCHLGNCQDRTSSKSFPITTLINAKWEQTPLHFEIAEYLADENANLYWDFLRDITSLDTSLSSYGNNEINWKLS